MIISPGVVSCPFEVDTEVDTDAVEVDTGVDTLAVEVTDAIEVTDAVEVTDTIEVTDTVEVTDAVGVDADANEVDTEATEIGADAEATEIDIEAVEVVSEAIIGSVVDAIEAVAKEVVVVPPRQRIQPGSSKSQLPLSHGFRARI